MAFALRCPDCRKTFPWNPSNKFPRYCLLCDADMGEETDDDVICLPAFLSDKTKSIDNSARQMMDSSNVRAEKAAELAGVPVSEMSDLKITDLRSTTHAGDIAMPVVSNAVTQHMDAMRARGLPTGFEAGPNAAEYSGAVQTGPHPNVGAKMRKMIHEGNGMVSNRPALETQAPGYRERA